MLFDRGCPGCGRRRPGARPICGICLADVGPVGPIPGPAGLDATIVLLRYQRSVPAIVVAAKNGGRRDALHQLGSMLAELVVPQPASVASGPSAVDVVTWVPASRRGVRRRGYDQGRILARAVARAAGLPSRRLLLRSRSPSRTGRGRQERLGGPPLRAPIGSPPHVLLVDDVITTGESMAAAADALRLAGARRVIGAAVAWSADDEEIAAASAATGRPAEGRSGAPSGQGVGCAAARNV